MILKYQKKLILSKEKNKNLKFFKNAFET